MAPPEGSIFDPALKWEEEKQKRRATEAEDSKAAAAATDKGKKAAGGGGSGGGKKGTEKKKTSAESIKETNAAEKLKKDLDRDLQKLSNLKTLKALQETSCETKSGKIHRMLKMLHLAASDLRQGAVHASEAEVLDILWALEEMDSFKKAEEEVKQDQLAKKEAKDKDKKDVKKDKDKDKKDARRTRTRRARKRRKIARPWK